MKERSDGVRAPSSPEPNSLLSTPDGHLPPERSLIDPRFGGPVSASLSARAELAGRLRPYRMALSGGGLVAAIMALRVGLLAAGSSDRYIAAIPDDAFYYFQLARNFAASRSWTFDGVAPATGFHPLYAYFLVGLHYVAGDLGPRSLLIVIGTVSAVAFGMAAVLAGATVTRLFGAGSVPLVVAVFLTPVALLQTTLLVEAWMVTLAASGVVFVVSGTVRVDRWRVMGIVTIGVLGALARTDFIVLPAAIALGYLTTRRVADFSTGFVRSLLVLGGSVIGLGLDAAQNVAISGSFLQSSVRIKAFWTTVVTTSLDPSIRVPVPINASLGLLISTVSPYAGGDPIVLYEATLCLAAGACFAVWALLHRRSSTMRLGSLPVIVGCALSLLGFLVLYHQAWAALQLWYASSFLVPSSILLAGIGRALLSRRLFILSSALAVGYGIFGLAHITDAPYTSQVADFQAGMALRAMKLDGPVGAWNAGIVGFVSGRDVVNLDGLVNDDAVPFILGDRLDDYMAARHVRYIADFGRMLDDPVMRKRGGYDDSRLAHCLLSPTSITSSTVKWWGSSYRLWEIKSGCL